MSNEVTTRQGSPVREVRVVQDDSHIGFLMDTAKFEHMQRLAMMMARGSLTPAHLKCGNDENGTMANCFRVANQAIRWGMDPFSIMDETYVVAGKLGYQGKLVIAVVNSRAGLAGRLNFSYSGEGDGRTIKVSGRFSGDAEPREITLSVAQAKTKNQMWVNDPDQKLAYSGATKWARRHCPEILLGVATEDELERMVESAVPVAALPHRGKESFRTPKATQETTAVDNRAAAVESPTPTPQNLPGTSAKVEGPQDEMREDAGRQENESDTGTGTGTDEGEPIPELNDIEKEELFAELKAQIQAAATAEAIDRLMTRIQTEALGRNISENNSITLKSMVQAVRAKLKGTGQRKRPTSEGI